jgi:AcrR family transcriptional regulator/transcriptional regulator with XRE-family HTH domain
MPNPEQDDNMAALGASVRCARHSRDWSVRQLATAIGVSAATVSAIENGRTAVTVDRLERISHALGTSAAALLGQRQYPGPTVRSSSSPAGSPASGRDWRLFPPLVVDPVLAAAIGVFVERGYHGATMRVIAGRAGISVAGVYHYYASKQDLLVSILDLTMSELDWRLSDSIQACDDPLVAVRMLTRALALFHTLRPELAFIGSSEMRSLEGHARRRIAKRRRAVQHLFDHQIQRAAELGLVHTSRPLETARAIASMCTALPQWFNPRGPTSPDEIAVHYADLALRMIETAT